MRASLLLRAAGPALALFLLLGWSGQALAQDTLVDGVVAVVSGKIITKYELDERMRPVYEQTRGRQLSTDEISQVASLRRRIIDQMI